ncbi:hypothetical protein C7974DRAFT_379297 [Boeremia exigua]|uniref:uncharacterized protein n=1 Tax=Boeremia exigua TaxID=749465 RepID=UPI001E8E8321|nr:uncharacterized protein C7974DRAFT_379297 [Boeremia exigua]KAH6616378.1 hypothetical protein C7974DRAFT_379297 [Boeremia exigua]
MAKKKTVSKATVKRTTTSPYTIPPNALRFGPDRQTYYVPKPLLQSLGELSEHDPWDSASNVPDVDADSGHVIVHFLYTGTYQTLIDEGEDVTTSLYASKELLKAALVCMAAKKYKLSDLEELARTEMKQCSTNASITELVQLISEDTFIALCNDSPWLQDFLTHKVEVAIKSSDDTFLMMGFFASIASSSLARFLAQEVVSIYHKENLELRSKTALSNGHSSTTTASPGAKESCEAESKLPAISKKKKKMKKGIPSEPAGIIASLPEPVVGSVPEVGSEPVKHSAPELVPEAEPAMVPEQEPETEATPTFETPYEESIAIPEVDYTEAVCDPFAGLSKSQKKKLEKKMKEEARLAEKENERVAKVVEEAVYDYVPPEAPLPSASPVPEVEPVPEAEAEAEPECVAEDPPPPEPTPVVVEDPSWDNWGWLSGSSKEKKKHGAVFFNDTPAQQEAATGSDIVEEVLPVDYTIIPDPTIEVAVAHNTDECPRRVEHLSGRDGWRACASCELCKRVKHNQVGST